MSEYAGYFKFLVGMAIVGIGCWLLQSLAAVPIAFGTLLVLIGACDRLCVVIPLRIRGAEEPF
jgi:hypothetical protein